MKMNERGSLDVAAQSWSTRGANIAAGQSGEIENSMEKLTPSDCLIRSVRVERINGHCLLPLGVIIARDLD